MKRIKIGNEYYRWRRGKLVKIPKAWVGEVLTPQTKRERHSKGTRKARNNRFSLRGSDKYIKQKREGPVVI